MKTSGVTPFQGPRHPRYVSLASRLATYQAWPPGLHQKPQQLAGAGFFYEGTSDQVTVFARDFVVIVLSLSSLLSMLGLGHFFCPCL